MLKKRIGLTLFIFILLSLGCTKKEKFIDKMDFKSKTKDNAKLYAKIEVEFKTKESFREYKKKKNEIKRAFGFIFDDYKSEQFDKELREGQGRGTIYVVMRKIFKSRLSEASYKSVKQISIIDYGIEGKK